MFHIKDKFLSLPVGKKLNLVFIAFLIVVVSMSSIFWFGVDIMSSLRGYVEGEGIWAKAQKDATINLLRYSETFNEQHYSQFKEALMIPLADKTARLELEKENFDLEVVEENFKLGGIHEEDIAGMIRLYRGFGDQGVVKEAIGLWVAGDAFIKELDKKGEDIHNIISSVDSKSELTASQEQRLANLLNDVNNINSQLTGIEDNFSRALGEGSRTTKTNLIWILTIIIVILSLLFWIFLSYVKRIVTRVDKAKTEFVYLASHQLKTPLTTINWYTDRLRRTAKDLSDQSKKYLQKINRNSKRITKLVHDLLNVSRVDMGGFVVNPEETDIVELTQEVLKDFKKNIDDKSLNVETNFDQDSYLLNIDKNIFELVVYNLLSNAVSYTPENGEITLEIKQAKKGERYNKKKIKKDSIILCVSDDGVGIAKEEQDKIFDKFFRTEKIKKHNTTGTGLGLYIVKSIVNQIKGDIWFESEIDKGTTFYVVFPEEGMEKKEGRKQLASYK